MMIKNLNHLRVVLAAAAAGVLLAVAMLVVAAVSPTEAAFPGQNGKIAFSRSLGSNQEIYTMNANGTRLDRLTKTTQIDSHPAWSPDGNKIAFTKEVDTNLYEIYTMNANGTGLDRLTNDPSLDQRPSWSPDGNKIAFSSDHDIYTMNADGTGLDRLTNSQSNRSPDWRSRRSSQKKK